MGSNLIYDGFMFKTNSGSAYIVNNIRKKHLLNIYSHFVADIYDFFKGDYITTYDISEIERNLSIDIWREVKI